MKRNLAPIAAAALFLLTGFASMAVRPAHGQSDLPAATTNDFIAPTVFQAAGPAKAAIQNTVDQYAAALGLPNNGNNGAQDNGHREINWDGRDVVTNGPLFDGFLVTRGALFTTPDGS